MNVKEIAQDFVQNPKIAAVVSAATTGTGAGTALDWIPDDIGKLATLVGIVLSVILIRFHLVGLNKAKLELEIMRAKEAERIAAAIERREKGAPLRRGCD